MVTKGLGLPNGAIILDEPNAVYYAGQLMSGNVHFEINEPVTFSAINIVFLGEALVQWTEGQNEMYGGSKTYREVNYEGREQYFNLVQCVYGGTGITTLPAGVHAIPFQFQVPFNIPSSFQGEDGKVTYRLTTCMELNPGSREMLEKEFQVVAPLNLNPLKNMMRPLELDFEEIETCNFLCQSDPINVKILLPSSVFNLGSTIPVVAKVKNDSSVEIYEICFKITMRHTYRTTQPRSEYVEPEVVLVEMRKGPVLANRTREYRWDLQLPDAMLPNLDGCSIMDVAFFFKVKIRMTGCNEDVDEETEIVIGLLPTSNPNEWAQSLAQHLPKAPMPNPNNPPAFAPNSNMIPINVASNRSPNEAANTAIPHNFGPASSTNAPYEIGFKCPNAPTFIPGPGEMSISGYPPYPSTVQSSGYPPPLPSGFNLNVETGSPPARHSLNSSQSNIHIVPSAPPL